MENNKKYIDKVIGSLLRGTKIDYEKERIYFPFSLPIHSSPLPLLFSFSLPYSLLYPFSTYCRNQFGLTEEEIDYVWNEYKKIMIEKIYNGQ